jgi:hypothetical protein
MNYLRNDKGQFRQSYFSATVLVVGMAIVFVGAGISALAEDKPVPQVIKVDNLTPKIEQLKADVLSLLKSCESKGYKESDAPIILDSNDRMSLGLFMFQKKTVIYFEKKLHDKTVTGLEATLIALNEKQATQLAKDIIFTVDGGVDEWHNCSVKLGLEQKVNLIKSLTN